jgi:hypothetical protein
MLTVSGGDACKTDPAARMIGIIGRPGILAASQWSVLQADALDLFNMPRFSRKAAKAQRECRECPSMPDSGADEKPNDCVPLRLGAFA